MGLPQDERRETETRRRKAMWDNLLSRGGPRNVAPALLRELRIYGGAAGVWVHSEVTRGLSAGQCGVAVSVLHNGSSYEDDLWDDGVIYHFPKTRRPPKRDASETAALRNACSLNVPIFVVTHTPDDHARRDVHLGKVVAIDDAEAQCLIEFSACFESLAPAGKVAISPGMSAGQVGVTRFAPTQDQTPHGGALQRLWARVKGSHRATT